METAVVVPYVTQIEIDDFKRAWHLEEDSLPDWLILQHDAHRDGCGVTKNRGVDEAIARGAEIVVVLDGDCYPCDETPTLQELMHQHAEALTPQPVTLFESVTSPPSRGTPYHAANHTVEMPVAASMGFWHDVPDHCAVRQLALEHESMAMFKVAVHGRYFPLCGMNLAFRPSVWRPWCDFIDVDRFDDIWMGWLWQREAYRRGFCFNLAGPMITHARQSNVWRNLIAEARYLEDNETLWRRIAMHPDSDYDALRSLLPV